MKRILPSLLFVIAIACQEPVSKQELYKYIQDPEHGLIHKMEKQGTALELLYRPKDIVISQQAGDDPTQRENVTRQLDSLDYFVLKLSRRGQEIENSLAGDSERFTAAVSYLSNGISADLSLITDGTTIPLEDMIYTQTFGSANGSNILIVFKSAVLKRDEDFTIVFNDTMFGTGRNEFEFKVDDVRQVPPLQF